MMIKPIVIALAMLLLFASDAWAWKPLFVGHRGCNIGATCV